MTFNLGLDIGMMNLNLSGTTTSGQVNPFAPPTSGQTSSQANPLIAGVPTMTSPISSAQQPYSSHKR